MKRIQRDLSSSLSIKHCEHPKPGSGEKEMTLRRCDQFEFELGSTLHGLQLTGNPSTYANPRVIRAKRLYGRGSLGINTPYLHSPPDPCTQTECCSLARQRHRSTSYRSWST